MSFFYPSTTSERRHEDFQLQVARGQIPGHRVVQVFGYNGDVDQTEESVWPNGGVVPHPVAASVLKISSSSASDTAAGTGARTVYIGGVDGDFDEVGETVTLNGQTAVNTINSYKYVNYLYVATAGTGAKNAGDINVGTGTVTSGVPAVLYDMIAVGFNQRTTAHFCVPAGHTGFMTSGVITVGQESGSSAITSFLKQHGPDEILRVGAITTMNNGSVHYDFAFPYVIPEKNCVGATAVGASNNNSVSTFFNIVLIAGPNASAPGTPWN
jgi:hypothetical protein